MLTRASFSLVIAAAAACSATPRNPIRVALLVEGERAAVGNVAPDAVSGLDLHPVTVPPPRPPAGDVTAAVIARALKAYGNGDWPGCLRELAQIDVVKLLVAGQRGSVARALVFEIACRAEVSRAEARVAAARFASLGLDMPSQFLAADLEELIATTQQEVGAAKLHAVAITGELGGRLSVDGRPASCTLPCTLDLPAGDHVLAVDSDGFSPAARLVRVPETTRVELPQAAATPELAAQQWRARLGRGLPPTDQTGAALIGRLAGGRVAYVHGGKRVTGALVVDGVTRATGERDRGETALLLRELAYDGGVLERPSVFARPWFWIAVSGAALAIAGAVVAVYYEPEIDSSVGF